LSSFFIEIKIQRIQLKGGVNFFITKARFLFKKNSQTGWEFY
jgi:hypothetical protein